MTSSQTESRYFREEHEIFRKSLRSFIDRELSPHAEALAARIYAAKRLAETVEQAAQVFGPAGLVQGHPLERFARDARMALWDGGGLGMDKELLAEQMGL